MNLIIDNNRHENSNEIGLNKIEAIKLIIYSKSLNLKWQQHLQADQVRYVQFMVAIFNSNPIYDFESDKYLFVLCPKCAVNVLQKNKTKKKSF